MVELSQRASQTVCAAAAKHLLWTPNRNQSEDES